MGVITDGDQSRADFIVITEANKRIRQLEKQCEALAVEVDAMRPVVEAAQRLVNLTGFSRSAELSQVVRIYEASKPK